MPPPPLLHLVISFQDWKSFPVQVAPVHWCTEGINRCQCMVNMSVCSWFQVVVTVAPRHRRCSRQPHLPLCLLLTERSSSRSRRRCLGQTTKFVACVRRSMLREISSRRELPLLEVGSLGGSVGALEPPRAPCASSESPHSQHCYRAVLAVGAL